MHFERPGGTIHYFAMEYVPGAKTLTDYAASKDLSIPDRLELFCHVCEAVDYGHGRGIIHRDLKPQNVLVDENGVVKVIDFGVARSTDSDVATATIVTEAGTLLGTLSYMSPEQCDADPLALDVRSDVYSLGVMLYEMLCGKLPYDVSKTSIYAAIRSIRETPPQPLADVNRRLGGDLQTIVEKALMKNPAERYTRVADFCRDVRHYLRREPIEARPATRWVRSLRWMMRHPKLTALSSSLGISAVIVLSTLVSIHLLNNKPYGVKLKNIGEPDKLIPLRNTIAGNCVELYAISGAVLHSWNTTGPKIRLAELVDRPTIWGGGKCVVLGAVYDPNAAWSGRLNFFDPDKPGEPYWTGSIDQATIDQMPHDAWPRPKEDSERVYVSDSFTFRSAWMFDVYPEEVNPGQEIVTTFLNNPHSQSVLRIYNLNGQVLFQAWYDGALEGAAWLSSCDLLLLTGTKGDMYPHEYSGSTGADHPIVIFAIRPEFGDISNRWIYPYKPGRPEETGIPARFEGDPWRAEQFEPQWFKAVCPTKYESTICMFRHSDRPNFPKDKFVLVNTYFPSLPKTDKGAHYELAYIIDGSGEIVHWDISNNAEVAMQQKYPNELPRAGDIELIDWVGRNHSCDGAPQSPPMQ